MFPVVKAGLISHLGGKESALSLTIVFDSLSLREQGAV